ncbi:MAG: hypothetical protein J0L63_11615 [Anaerolineae bacterium]|nr:hypothetical protein [Anaerolineae bacterium]
MDELLDSELIEETARSRRKHRKNRRAYEARQHDYEWDDEHTEEELDEWELARRNKRRERYDRTKRL